MQGYASSTDPVPIPKLAKAGTIAPGEKFTVMFLFDDSMEEGGYWCGLNEVLVSLESTTLAGIQGAAEYTVRGGDRVGVLCHVCAEL